MLSHSKVDNLKGTFAAKLIKGTSARRRSGKWECKLSEMLIGEYLISPLTSTKSLKSEAYWMNNCSRDYISQCANLEYCLFSMRSRSGERLATLGIICDEDYWRFDQCLGQSNTDVLEETMEYLDEDDMLQTESFATELYYVAHEVVRLMNATTGIH